MHLLSKKVHENEFKNKKFDIMFVYETLAGGSVWNMASSFRRLLLVANFEDKFTRNSEQSLQDPVETFS